MTQRTNYLRGGEKYDTRITGAAINRIADLLDIADNRVSTSVSPDIYGYEFSRDRELGWCWAAILLADVADIDSATLRNLANAINGIYDAERD